MKQWNIALKINVYIPLNGIPTQWFPMLIVSHEKLFISFYHIPVSKYNSCPLTLRLILLIQFKHCITNPKSVNISCWFMVALTLNWYEDPVCRNVLCIPVYSQIVIWSGKNDDDQRWGIVLLSLCDPIFRYQSQAISHDCPMIFTLIFLCFEFCGFLGALQLISSRTCLILARKISTSAGFAGSCW